MAHLMRTGGGMVDDDGFVTPEAAERGAAPGHRLRLAVERNVVKLPTREEKKKRRNETADLTKPIIALLAAMPGVVAMRNQVGFGYMAHDHSPRTFGLGNGSADIVGSIDGRAAAWEVKWPGKKLTADQRAWHAARKAYGWFCCTVTSEDEARAAVVRCRLGMSE